MRTSRPTAPSAGTVRIFCHGMARYSLTATPGALATGGFGTALGVAHEPPGKKDESRRVLATETRPFLQGARLTAWELARAGVDASLIADSAAGHMMQIGEVDAVVTGADRVAANGDVANKIGTYPLAVLARENGIPFYVAAPTNTLDLSLASGREIVIEYRSPAEVTDFDGERVAAKGVEAINPAFDVTPHEYVTAIVTERGVVHAPYSTTLRRIVEDASG